MALLPADLPPSTLTLGVHQPSAKARAVNGIDTQARGSGVFLFEVKFSYSLLEFSERDNLMAFLISQGGRANQFDVFVPTHCENNEVNNATATLRDAQSIGDTSIALSGMSGRLNKLNLIRFNGYKGTYAVTVAPNNIGGVQTVTIVPPLRHAFSAGQVVLTKDVPINMALDEDTIDAKSKGMSSSISFSMVEEPK